MSDSVAHSVDADADADVDDEAGAIPGRPLQGWVLLAGPCTWPPSSGREPLVSPPADKTVQTL